MVIRLWRSVTPHPPGGRAHSKNMNNATLLYDVNINSFWICGFDTGVSELDGDKAATLAFFTFFGCLAGFGMTYLVQNIVPLHIRKHMIKGSHFFVGFIWIVAISSCTPLTFPFVVFSTYLWGSEPYDNVFSQEMWVVVWKLWRMGEKVHAYWAFSSLIIHFWFVLGAAWLNLGLNRPSWILLAIGGFSCSHMARVFAYDHRDIISSILEIVGVLCLLACTALEALNWTVFTLIWLTTSTFERITHLPSAFRGDAGWMRSYDLWEAAVMKAHEGEPKVELSEIHVRRSPDIDRKESITILNNPL